VVLKEPILKETDPEVFGAIEAELRRERESLVMIASENYASRAVMEAQANVMTNKYAEGYPGARYYGGCEFVDKVERLARSRANRLFDSEHANVQPHSGSQANMAVYLAVLNQGDTILGMDLSHGGHLTHGSPVSFSGKIYNPVFYGLHPDTGRIDYDQVRDIALRHKPKIIIAGASAYPRRIDFSTFGTIARDVGAYFMVDMAHIAGLVAVNLHPSPVGHADFITSTTHKTLRGPRGGLILCSEEYGPKIDKSVFPGTQGGPLMHIVAAKAVAFEEALRSDFTAYQEQVLHNALVLAESLLEYGFNLVTGGTDNHLVLIDLTNKGISGLDAERALNEAGIVSNKNAVPFDKRGPKITSGLRLGTPALTTRGLKEPEIRRIATLINDILSAPEDDTVLRRVQGDVFEICGAFPIYPYLHAS
jgi:glycine hydroxymethyltransferase